MSQHGLPRPPSRDPGPGRALRPASRDGTANAAPSFASATGRTESAAQQRLRPAFTTLQQHYSPAKSLAPKPLTSTFLAPSSPSKLPANVALSAETSRQQAELLRLHLLHRSAAATDAEWRASARERLGARFAEVAGREAAVAAEEAACAELVNVAALRRWGSSPATQGRKAAAAGIGENGRLEDRIQALDGIVSGLWSLGEAGGRYARVVRRFERWAERMREIESARRGGRRDAGALADSTLLDDRGEPVFVGGLDAAWADECAHIARRLDGWQARLDVLGDVPPPPPGAGDDVDELEGRTREMSSLERMLAGCRCLVRDMRAELAVMGRIVADSVAGEDEWVARMTLESGEREADTPRAGAIWRVV